DGFGRRRLGDRAAIGGEDAAFEPDRARGDLAADPAITDDSKGAAHYLTMRRAAELLARTPGPVPERRHRVEQPMHQDEHRHDHILGDSRLVAEYVADRYPLRHRIEIDLVEAGCHRLQQA